MPLPAIDLDAVRKDRGRVLMSNASASLLDLDDGVRGCQTLSTRTLHARLPA